LAAICPLTGCGSRRLPRKLAADPGYRRFSANTVARQFVRVAHDAHDLDPPELDVVADLFDLLAQLLHRAGQSVDRPALSGLDLLARTGEPLRQDTWIGLRFAV
jgi:hypothetical protein